MFGLIATLSLVVVGAHSAVFSDDFAYNNMLPLAAAAYSDHPDACVRNHFNGQVVRFYKVDCRGPLRISVPVTCSAYTAVIPSRNAIVLSFRGTDSIAQLLKEGAYCILSKKWFGGASVNTYFLSAFNSLWGRMYNDVVNLIRSHPNKDIWITGHSLGGALASLAASFLLEKKNAQASNTKLVTFGQPRTGDGIFAGRLNNLIDYAFRVVHDNDAVPQIPLRIPTLFGKFQYQHHKQEVYYGQTMVAGKVCNPGQCSDKIGFFSLNWSNVHKCYYGKYLSLWGENGCVATPAYLRDNICK